MEHNSHAGEPETLKSYGVGFTLSLLLTFASYFLVTKHLLTGQALAIAISGLGLLQAFVQLIFFLHLGKETKPRWNLLIFLFMVLVLFVIVVGSLWIMYNLNYRMMSAM